MRADNNRGPAGSGVGPRATSRGDCVEILAHRSVRRWALNEEPVSSSEATVDVLSDYTAIHTRRRENCFMADGTTVSFLGSRGFVFRGRGPYTLKCQTARSCSLEHAKSVIRTLIGQSECVLYGTVSTANVM